MKNFLVILGGLFLAIIVIAAVGFAYVATTGSALDTESKAYAEAAIPAIIADWDGSELSKRESPEFAAVVSAADLDKLIQNFRRLGKLKQFNGVKGEAMLTAVPQHGSRITANYVGSAEFDTGPAQIDLGLIKHGDDWQILRFRVNSRAFLDTH
jgi:hypothetical protein